MQFKVFTVPLFSGDVVLEEMNKFLAGVRIIEVKREVVQHEGSMFWTFCISYISSGSSASSANSNQRDRIDYKEILNEHDYYVYLRLRDIREVMAKSRALALYVIFTNAELAEIAKMEKPTLAELKKIKGISKERANKYGAEMLKKLEESLKDDPIPKSDEKVEVDLSEDEEGTLDETGDEGIGANGTNGANAAEALQISNKTNDTEALQISNKTNDTEALRISNKTNKANESSGKNATKTKANETRSGNASVATPRSETNQMASTEVIESLDEFNNKAPF